MSYLYAISVDNKGYKRIRLPCGTHVRYRAHHAVADFFATLWYGRSLRAKQRLFAKQGAFYYGDGGTIHNNTHLDVEVDAHGRVLGVWFRCIQLPYKTSLASNRRASDLLRIAAENPPAKMHGVVVAKAPGPKS